MNYINRPFIKTIIRKALKEDVGRCDITTKLIIPEDEYAKAVLIAKENCVVCGMDIARGVFKLQDKNIKFNPKFLDGQIVKKGDILARIYGKAQSILTAERVALNFLSLLSGIATKTADFVNKVKPWKVKIMDTRKTLPGLRELEKYAVRVGGGFNHRLRLDEMVLIKDNHLRVAGGGLGVEGLRERIKKIRKEFSKKMKIEIEVKNLKEFKEALKLKPDIIMLDNMSIEEIKKAVKIRNSHRPSTIDHRPKLEASGRVTLKNVRQIAATGVDMLSIGALTHSVNSVDISLEII